MTDEELMRIRQDWHIENPDLAVNEQRTINQLLDEIDRLRKLLTEVSA